MDDTKGEAYARRLSRTRATRVWSRIAQAPYRWHLRRQNLGITLDIGCGVGRHLHTLPAGSLGVDHNRHSVAVARDRGLSAMTVEEWTGVAASHRERFDSLLLAHVLEHLPRLEAEALLKSYLPYLRPGGLVLLICPQERGFQSDPTHVSWTTGEDLEHLAEESGLLPSRWRSFPLPRWAGKIFTHNEFSVLARKPAA